MENGADPNQIAQVGGPAKCLFSRAYFMKYFKIRSCADENWATSNKHIPAQVYHDIYTAFDLKDTLFDIHVNVVLNKPIVI